MPRTPATSDAQLGVILESAPGSTPHKPGDTISGRVYRTAAGVAPEARVTVTIHGRCKSKMEIRRGNSTSTYRSRFNALSAPVETQVLMAGMPLHIPGGSEGESWPFAIAIPPLVSDIRSEWQRKYFACPGGSDATFPPPPSLFFKGDSWFSGKEYHAFTEYYVEAKLYLLHQHNGSNVRDTYTATAPFPLENAYLGPPISEGGFKMMAYSRRDTVSTYHLVPGTGELSFGQKTRKALGSSKVPKLTFELTISLPRILQIGNKNTIPVTLGITSVNTTTSEIIYDIPQDVMITSVRIRVKANTSVQAERHSASDSSPGVRLGPIDPFRALGQNICIPVIPGPGAGPSNPLNIGEILGIRMPNGGLHPDLVTYNITRTHMLKWDVEGTIAGEKFQLGSAHRVKILPRAAESEVVVESLPGYSAGGTGKEDLPAYSG
ncbi:hypothetical protein BJX99DRAFT_202229 [Aspergillus californicus]